MSCIDTTKQRAKYVFYISFMYISGKYKSPKSQKKNKKIVRSSKNVVLHSVCVRIFSRRQNCCKYDLIIWSY